MDYFSNLPPSNPLPATISDPSTPITACNSPREPNLRSSYLSQPSQGYGSVFPTL